MGECNSKLRKVHPKSPDQINSLNLDVLASNLKNSFRKSEKVNPLYVTIVNK